MSEQSTSQNASSQGKLSGKTAVITGGTTGIGFATAKRFLSEGAQVVVTGRNEQTLAQARAELGSDALVVKSDASKLSDIDNLFAQIKTKFGGVDVLFINAGIGKFAPIDTIDETTFDQTMNVNFKGAFFTLQKALPLLREGASVVLTTSCSNVMGMAGLSVYAPTKAALRSLARVASAELAERKIRVNAISPGPIETPIFNKMGLSKEALEETAQQILSKVPMQRFGTSDEIAKAALFLASDDSAYVLGTELVADGGMSQL